MGKENGLEEEQEPPSPAYEMIRPYLDLSDEDSTVAQRDDEREMKDIPRQSETQRKRDRFVADAERMTKDLDGEHITMLEDMIGHIKHPGNLTCTVTVSQDRNPGAYTYTNTLMRRGRIITSNSRIENHAILDASHPSIMTWHTRPIRRARRGARNTALQTDVNRRALAPLELKSYYSITRSGLSHKLAITFMELLAMSKGDADILQEHITTPMNILAHKYETQAPSLKAVLKKTYFGGINDAWGRFGGKSVHIRTGPEAIPMVEYINLIAIHSAAEVDTSYKRTELWSNLPKGSKWRASVMLVDRATILSVANTIDQNNMLWTRYLETRDEIAAEILDMFEDSDVSQTPGWLTTRLRIADFEVRRMLQRIGLETIRYDAVDQTFLDDCIKDRAIYDPVQYMRGRKYDSLCEISQRDTGIESPPKAIVNPLEWLDAKDYLNFSTRRQENT